MGRIKVEDKIEDRSVRNIKVLLNAEEDKQFELVKKGVGEKTGSNAFRALIPIFFRYESFIKTDSEQKQKIRNLEIEIQQMKERHKNEIREIIKTTSNLITSFKAVEKLNEKYMTDENQ